MRGLSKVRLDLQQALINSQEYCSGIACEKCLLQVCFSSVSSAQAAAQPAGQVFDALAEEVLPACQQPFAGEESTAAQDIVLKLLEASRGFQVRGHPLPPEFVFLGILQSSPCQPEAEFQYSQGGIQTELLRSMAAIATTATAGLDVGEQQPIAKALTSCFALAREKDATAAFEAPMTISCRVLLALRPGEPSVKLKPLQIACKAKPAE